MKTNRSGNQVREATAVAGTGTSPSLKRARVDRGDANSKKSAERSDENYVFDDNTEVSTGSNSGVSGVNELFAKEYERLADEYKLLEERRKRINYCEMALLRKLDGLREIEGGGLSCVYDHGFDDGRKDGYNDGYNQAFQDLISDAHKAFKNEREITSELASQGNDVNVSFRPEGVEHASSGTNAHQAS
ncbi:MAG: hypothetical protein AAF621_06045 [Pseudomonadota bacterium]